MWHLLLGGLLVGTMKRRQKRKHLENEESQETAEKGGGMWGQFVWGTRVSGVLRTCYI